MTFGFLLKRQGIIVCLRAQPSFNGVFLAEEDGFSNKKEYAHSLAKSPGIAFFKCSSSIALSIVFVHLSYN